MVMLLGAFVLLLVYLGFFWWSNQLKPVSPGDTEQQTFIIEQGSAASQIAEQLVQQGLTRSVLVTRVYLKANALEHSIRPGYYTPSRSQTLPQIIHDFVLGPKDLWITIIEGWRREQIAAEISQTLSGYDSPFSSVDFLRQTSSIEGQLFPDSYLIPSYESTSAVINILTRNFVQKSGLVLPRDTETLIVASLIEREAKSDPDRSLIAGIIWKRLEAGWPLQIDATAQYASDSIRCAKDPITCRYWVPEVDTKISSAFNTYLQSGLPPQPVCNPGQAAISAAANPQKSPYWYYLTDSRGVTHYAITLQEHNTNIDKYLLP
jgi:UPF0755 protein